MPSQNDLPSPSHSPQKKKQLKSLSESPLQNSPKKILANITSTTTPTVLEAFPKTQEITPFFMGWNAASEKELLGKVIGNCQILKKLGQGGMGAVYLAKHLGLQTNVALKLLLLGAGVTSEMVERFFWEAKTIAKVEHPNVVRVYDVGESPPFYYITMQFVEGTNLQTLIDQHPLDWKEALFFIRSAACGLRAAHDKGIIHRDIKPANLLISPEKELKIADFGLARIQNQKNSFSFTGQLLGTPYFMSPEQCSGIEVDTRTDIYSLGISLYYALTGQYPFAGESIVSVIYKQLNEEPLSILKINPKFPENLHHLLTRMLEKQKETRYATMQEVIQDIDCLLHNRPLTWQSTEFKTRVLEDAVPQKKKRSWTLISVLALGILGLGLLVLWRSQKKSSTSHHEPSVEQLAKIAYDSALSYRQQHPEKIREVLEHWDEANKKNHTEALQESIRQEVRIYLDWVAQKKQSQWKTCKESPEYQELLNRMNFTAGLKWVKSQENFEIPEMESFSGLIQIELQEVLGLFRFQYQTELENLQLAEKRFLSITFPLLTAEDPLFKLLLEEQTFYQAHGFQTKLLEEKRLRIQQLTKEKMDTLLANNDFCGAWDLGKEKEMPEEIFQEIDRRFHFIFQKLLETYSKEELSSQMVEWERRALLSEELKARCQSKLFSQNTLPPITSSDPLETETETEEEEEPKELPEKFLGTISKNNRNRFFEVLSFCSSRHYEDAASLVSQILEALGTDSERILWEDFQQIIRYLKQFQDEWTLILLEIPKKEQVFFSSLKPEDEQFFKSIQKKKKLSLKEAEALFKRMDPHLCLKKLEIEPFKGKEPSEAVLLGLGYFALFFGLPLPEKWKEKINILFQSRPLSLKILEEGLEGFRKRYQPLRLYTPFAVDKGLSSFLMIDNVFSYDNATDKSWVDSDDSYNDAIVKRWDDLSGVKLEWKRETPPVPWKKQLMNFSTLDFAVLPPSFRLQFSIKTEKQFLMKLQAFPEQYTFFWANGEFRLESRKIELSKRAAEPLDDFMETYERAFSQEKKELGCVPFSLFPADTYVVEIEFFAEELRIHLAHQEQRYTLFTIKTSLNFKLHFLSFGGSSPLNLSQFQVFQLHQKTLEEEGKSGYQKISKKTEVTLQEERWNKWFKEKKKEESFPWELKDKKLQSKKDLLYATPLFGFPIGDPILKELNEGKAPSRISEQFGEKNIFFPENTKFSVKKNRKNLDWRLLISPSNKSDLTYFLQYNTEKKNLIVYSSDIVLNIPFTPECPLGIQEFWLEAQIQDSKNTPTQLIWTLPNKEYPEDSDCQCSLYIYWGDGTLSIVVNGHLVFVRNQINKVSATNQWNILFSREGLYLILNDFFLMLPFSDLELEAYHSNLNLNWTFRLPVQLSQLQISSIYPQKK
ncbi:MAG: serine/threonine-protein kinase [Planctomycetota bacterium]